MSAKVESYEVSRSGYMGVSFSDRSEYGEMEVGITVPSEAFDAVAEHLGGAGGNDSSMWISVKDSSGREITLFRGMDARQ